MLTPRRGGLACGERLHGVWGVCVSGCPRMTLYLRPRMCACVSPSAAVGCVGVCGAAGEGLLLNPPSLPGSQEWAGWARAACWCPLRRAQAPSPSFFFFSENELYSLAVSWQGLLPE